MKLQDAEILKLLPAWMQEDASNKGLAAGTDKVTRAINARLRLLSRWNRLNELTEEELDDLALDLAIPWYETAANVETKRAVIKNSDLVFAKLGTPYAVEQIVTDYFGAGVVKEWYEYGGKPHHFKILSDNPELVNNNLERFLKLLADAKRRSSWLDAILICLTGEMRLFAAMAVRDHTNEEHVMGCDEIYIYYAAVVHDNNRETVTIGSTTPASE